MICFLLMIVVIIIFCSCLAPHQRELQASAVRVLESSVNMMGRFGPPDDQEDDMPERKPAWAPPRAEARQRRSPGPGKRDSPNAAWKTALYRKRPTPLMQKKVAVRFGFKCAICKQPLDETWEVDHLIPLNTARTAAEAEALNSIENLQPVHRACHQMKTSREARR